MVVSALLIGCSDASDDFGGSAAKAGTAGTAGAGTGGAATGGAAGSSKGGSGGSATAGSAGSATGGTGGAGGTAGTTGVAGTGGAAGRAGAGIDGAGGAGGGGTGGGGRADAGGTSDVRDAGVTPDVSTPPADGATGCGLANVVSKAYFDQIFPLGSRHAVYTYEGLLAAAAVDPAFVNTGTVDTCRKEAAAFLANVARETGRLVYAEQIAKAAYCSTRTGCACDPNTTDQTKWYYGRGAIQLSWNYNYCSAGAAFGQDFLGQPNLVSTVPQYAWGTAIWFWMTSTGAGNMTCHAAMAGGSSFGETIRTINGGIECNAGGYTGNSAVKARVDAYIQYATGLGVASPGLPADLDC